MEQLQLPGFFLHFALIKAPRVAIVSPYQNKLLLPFLADDRTDKLFKNALISATKFHFVIKLISKC